MSYTSPLSFKWHIRLKQFYVRHFHTKRTHDTAKETGEVSYLIFDKQNYEKLVQASHNFVYYKTLCPK